MSNLVVSVPARRRGLRLTRRRSSSSTARMVLAFLALSMWNRTALADDPAPPAKTAEAAADAPKGDDAHEKKDGDARKPVDRKGQVMEIGLFVTSVSKIDVLKETWELEAILTLAGPGELRECKTGPIQELFVDGLVKKVDEVDEGEEGGKPYRQCKVTVEQDSSIDVSRYPFDEHQLDVTIGDEGDAGEGVQFKPSADPDSIGTSPKVKLAGWELGALAARQEQFDSPSSKDKLTRVVFELPAYRPRAASFVKGFLGVLFQLLIALVALVLSVKAAPNRIGIATGALIAVATAHNQISGQIGVSYLTTADKFFFLSYFLLLANIVFTAAMLRADEAKNEARAKWLYRTAWLVLPALTVLGSVLVLGGVV